MEGLDLSVKTINEVKYEDETFRLDSEFFGRLYLDTIEKIKSFKTVKLSLLCSWITQGPNPLFTDVDGLPCLTGRNICDGRVNYERADIVSEQEYEALKRFQIKDGDTLITLKGKGSIGKIGFVINCRKSIFSRNIGIIRPKSISPSYLNAYLLSKYGQILIQRGETGGTGQSTLTCTYIKNIDIPRINIEDRIGEFILSAETLLLKSQNVYLEAEKVLLRELGLNDWVPTNQTSTTKCFSDFLGSGRLDAEYYQPKYDEIEKQIANYGCGNIDQLFELKDKNFIPKNDVQYKYIELSNIGGSGEITGCSYEYGSDLPSRARRKVNTGDVIVSSIEGSLQSCAVITEEYNNSLCSNGFYVLAPKTISAETSLILFKSAPIQQLMKKVCSGTILTAMNKDEFVNIPIPIVAENIQQQITDKVQKSFELRAESKRLLDLAKTAVEMAIEQGEQNALELLKQN